MFLPDKPGKYGILFKYLADAEDRYVSRAIPCSFPAINSQSNESIQELVMEMCSDILNTGRNVTVDCLYSSVETAEKLYEKSNILWYRDA